MMTQEQVRLFVELISGLEVAVLTLFQTLDRKGVMPLAEAREMLQSTIAALPPGEENSQMAAVLRHLIEGMRQPDPPTRTPLQIIEGGRRDA